MTAGGRKRTFTVTREPLLGPIIVIASWIFIIRALLEKILPTIRERTEQDDRHVSTTRFLFWSMSTAVVVPNRKATKCPHRAGGTFYFYFYQFSQTFDRTCMGAGPLPGKRSPETHRICSEMRFEYAHCMQLSVGGELLFACSRRPSQLHALP